MDIFILSVSIIIILGVVLNKISMRAGLPVLLAFIVLGMVLGEDGPLHIEFQDYGLAKNICSIALIFIMFYGGFGTNLGRARCVAVRSALLSTVGVFLTAMLIGLFGHFVVGAGLIESLLLGSVIASTDAASVFSILRSRKLGLKYNTASLLEMESGSNDPAAYMLTVIFIEVMSGNAGAWFIISTVLMQLTIGALLGLAIGYGGGYLMKRTSFDTEGFEMVFAVGIALISYALPSTIGGNGYLSAYLAGLIIGNHEFEDKKNLVHFFDGVTGLMQMLLFFLLGMLATPSALPLYAMEATVTMVFLTLVARPVSVALLLAPFGCSVRQIALVSFAGLRGAASIVFAILVITGTSTGTWIFHVTFFIVLMSIIIQGGLLPLVSRKLGMIDEKEDVMKTFNDYSEALPVQFIQFKIPENHNWVGKTLQEITLPPETLVVYRENNNVMSVPDGRTVIEVGDKLILSAKEPEQVKGIHLAEIPIGEGHEYIGLMLSEIPKGGDNLVILIVRGDKVVIPQGSTKIKENDVLICNRLVEYEIEL